MIKVLIQIEADSCERNLSNEKTLEYKGQHHMSRPFPYPYGFIIGTSAADGDCVDCYIITNDRLKAGIIVECDPVGIDLDEWCHRSMTTATAHAGAVYEANLLNEERFPIMHTLNGMK